MEMIGFSVVDEDLDSLWGDGWETEELSGMKTRILVLQC